MVLAIRRPTSRIQDLTAKLQYWKAFFDLAPLADSKVDDNTKALCREELASTEDEVKNLSNKFVSLVTTVYTLFLMMVITLLIERCFSFVLAWMRQQFLSQPPQLQQSQIQQFKDVTQQMSYVSLITQALVMCLIWFWARWKIRNFVWNGLRPGKMFHFLLNGDRRLQAFAELTLLIFFPLAMGFIMKFVSEFPQNVLAFQPGQWLSRSIAISRRSFHVVMRPSESILERFGLGPVY